MMEILVGRDKDCDHVILDPKKRVSRKHAIIVRKGSDFYIMDINSTNGVYINGVRVKPNVYIKFDMKSKITLSKTYELKVNSFINFFDDSTQLIQTGRSDNLMRMDNGKMSYSNGKGVVSLDMDKTTIGDILEFDQSPFVSVGRGEGNTLCVNNNGVSRNHCKIRLVTPLIIEIEDLGSSNGTFADDKKLSSGKRFQFSSAVKIRLGVNYNLDLKKIFPGIKIIEKREIQKVAGSKVPEQKVNPQLKPLTKKEKKEFLELEGLWNEYLSRQNSIGQSSMTYGIGGTALGLAAAALGIVTGPAGMVVIAGGGIIGRYLGQQKTNEIRSDLTYENAFLEGYCCPRCKESFQKKPWVTIRECFRCKLKFR
jgi:pSer/pThr/pTyr-binding forkhead associated (FHA) protein/ribosomal protein L37AE/L43A